MRYFVILVLICILGFLFSALFFMFRDKGDSRRMVKALTWRVAPLEMQWCLDCHRAPEKYLRPVEHVFDMDWKPTEDPIALGTRLVAAYHIHKSTLTDCSTCHR